MKRVTWEEFNTTFAQSDTTEKERRKIYLMFSVSPWIAQDECIFKEVLRAYELGASVDEVELLACCLENYMYQQGGSSHDHLRTAIEKAIGKEFEL